MLMLDIGYSDIRYNVGLCALQSDIRHSDIRLSPISLIMDIGLSAHLCWQQDAAGDQCFFQVCQIPATKPNLAFLYCL
jgi:hypothetical protein